MTAPVTSSSAGTASGASVGAALGNASSLGKDDFIKLLVAQLKHQDPMNPQDGTQMATQLAQFSSVEQLMNINNTLTAQGSANAGMSTALENATAIGLIGKQVSIAEPGVTVGPDAIDPYQTELPSAGNVTVSLLDSTGKVVRTEALGAQAAGRQSLDIGGLASGLAAGTYTIKVSLTDAAGRTTSPATFITKKVDGVQFGPNGLVLRSGTKTYPLTGVTSVDASN
ncbi:MAG: flagellar hook assembly protein FlgD, partial [Gemmatimonadetes bacterium]|nr:flagellar hook assembly protein FlgD [Gemmatimonadota bacterium]